MGLDEIRRLIRDVPDFPKPGIVFKDITPLLGHGPAFARAVELMTESVLRHRPQALAAIESRGFLFGAAIASHLALPLQLVRKPGKLPWQTAGVSYALEYGTDRLEMHVDAVSRGARYAIVDDLLATGGTASATAELVRNRGGEVACAAFLIELDALGGRARLNGVAVESLLHF